MSAFVSISKPAYEWLSDRANEMGTSVEDELNNAIALSMRLDGYRVMTRRKRNQSIDSKNNGIESLFDDWFRKAKADLSDEKISATMLYERFLSEAEVSKMQMSQTAFGRIASQHFQKKRYAEGYYYLVG